MTQKNKGLPFQNNSLFALLVTPCPASHALIPHGGRHLQSSNETGYGCLCSQSKRVSRMRLGGQKGRFELPTSTTNEQHTFRMTMSQ